MQTGSGGVPTDGHTGMMAGCLGLPRAKITIP